MTAHLITTLSEGILTLQFNRSDKKNALTGAMYTALADAILDAAGNALVRVIVLKGSEGCFCAGNDLKDFLDAPRREGPAPAHRLIHALADTTLPLIAAVDGVAVGIGTTMLLHCDFVYATPRAVFSLPFINLGLVPEAGSSLLLPRLAGYQQAAQLLLLGEPFTPAHAQQLGLITAVCEPSELAGLVETTARKLAAKPHAALRKTKELLKRGAEPVRDRVKVEVECFNEFLASAAARECMSAFMEKRKPDPARFEE